MQSTLAACVGPWKTERGERFREGAHALAHALGNVGEGTNASLTRLQTPPDMLQGKDLSIY